MTLTMETSSAIEKKVMRRVYTVRILRPILGNVGVAVTLFALALYAIKREVWVAQVFANMPESTLVAPRFFIDAFLHTEVLVQVAVVLAFGVCVWSVRELVRAVAVTRVSIAS